MCPVKITGQFLLVFSWFLQVAVDATPAFFCDL